MACLIPKVSVLPCREMTASRDALELELKHNEKEFASLVTEELEQRFARFEDVTLAAVSKLGPSGTPALAALPAPYRTPTGQSPYSVQSKN